MSEIITRKLTCDVCNKTEEVEVDSNCLPNDWFYIRFNCGRYDSDNFIICRECRNSMYKVGFFGKAIRKLFKI